MLASTSVSIYLLLFSDVLFERLILMERLIPGTQTAQLRHHAISSCKVRLKKGQLFQGFFSLVFFFFPETAGIGDMLLTALWSLRHGI